MRAVLTLVLIFGAIGIAYAIQWSRRAASTLNDATVLLRETGSISQTAAKLMSSYQLPPDLRLSRRQEDYLNSRYSEFVAEYRSSINIRAKAAMDVWIEERGKPCTDQEFNDHLNVVFSMLMLRYGKTYCESRGIF